MTRVYYRGPAGIVTDSHFVPHPPDGPAFPLDELRDVRIIRRHGVRSVWFAALTAGVLTADGLLAVSLTRRVGWPAGVAMAATGVVAAVALLRVYRPSYVLVGVYRGRTVELYSTTDKGALGRICRTLRHALEDFRPG